MYANFGIMDNWIINTSPWDKLLCQNQQHHRYLLNNVVLQVLLFQLLVPLFQLQILLYPLLVHLFKLLVHLFQLQILLFQSQILLFQSQILLFQLQILLFQFLAPLFQLQIQLLQQIRLFLFLKLLTLLSLVQAKVVFLLLI